MTIATSASFRGSPTARAIACYSVLVIAIEVFLTVAMNRAGQHSAWATPIMLGIMWTPGLVAIALQLFTSRNLRGFGWKPGPLRWWVLAYVFPLIYGGLALLFAQALGGGSIDFERWSKGAVRWGMPEHALFGMLIQMTIFMIPGIVTGLGEEIGWRGFMVPRLAKYFGFWSIVNTSFVIWLGFHLPGMLIGGYHGQGTPLWYSLVCFAALLYPATILMTWLRLRSGSLWPCVIHHAAHNCFIQVMWNSAFKPNDLTPWLLGEFGVLLPVLLSLMVTLLIALAGLPESRVGRSQDDASPPVPTTALPA